MGIIRDIRKALNFRHIDGPVVVLNSGGFDSVTVMHELKEWGCKELHSLFFDYGQFALRREKANAEYWASKVGASHTELKIQLPWATSLLLGNSDDPYVPMRNLVFLSYAVSYADQIGAKYVSYGAHYENRYPDNSLQFIRNFDRTTNRSCGVRLLIPFLWHTKDELFAHGFHYFFLHPHNPHIWTCDNSLDHRCGECDQCFAAEDAIARGVIPPYLERHS